MTCHYNLIENQLIKNIQTMNFIFRIKQNPAINRVSMIKVYYLNFYNSQS